jgi:O-antigen/teichoic acid export membrane protein
MTVQRRPPPLPTSGAAVLELLSNQVSRIWAMGLQFFIAPIIARLLGAESYGFISFYMTMLALLVFLTQGPCSVAMKLLAHWPQLDQDGKRRSKAAIQVLELIALASSVMVAGIMFVLAPWFVDRWLNVSGVSHDEAVTTVRLIGLGMACQWLHPFYTACFAGLHRQTAFALPLIVFTTVQNVGGVVLLELIAPRLDIYLIWNAAVWVGFNWFSHARFATLLGVARASIGQGLASLGGLHRFAVGTTLFALVNSTLAQGDKLAVSHLVSLQDLAAYGLSFTAASLVMTVAATPVGSILMPIISRCALSHDEAVLAREYHRWTQVLLVLALPVAATLIAFSRPLAELWLGKTSPLLAPIAEILPWATAGMFLTALNAPPQLLQWGHGRTRLSLAKSLVALPLYIIALFVMLPRFGAIAGAWCWMAVNLGYLLIEVPIMHRRLLPRELWRWWGCDLLLPIAVTVLLYASARSLPIKMFNHDRSTLIIGVVGLALANVALVIAVLPHARRLVLDALRNAAGRINVAVD